MKKKESIHKFIFINFSKFLVSFEEIMLETKRFLEK